MSDLEKEIDELLTKIANGYGAERSEASAAILEKGEKAVPILQRYADSRVVSQDFASRFNAACWLLAANNGNELSDVLVGALRITWVFGWREVAALGVFEKCIPGLIKALTHEDSEVAGYAATALGMIGEKALEPVMNAFKSGEVSYAQVRDAMKEIRNAMARQSVDRGVRKIPEKALERVLARRVY